ncbi:MAG: single-stranded DNA-binding protein [Treponema sp.]|nr:single-stranded DNA-binding protein [Treponema sp.]
MNQLNSLIIEGNITRDAEFKESPHGCKIGKIPIAVNRWYKSGDGKGIQEVSYFDVEVYGKMAEYCESRAIKGRGTRVVGRIKQNRWTTAEGKTASRVTVIAEHVEFKPQLGKKGDSGEELADIAEANEAAAEEINEEEAEAVAF